MDLHRGRLIDHLHLRVKDLEASKRFYQACMDVLGIPLDVADDHISCDELWIDEGPDEVRSHAHFAFQAKDEETVRRWHAAVLAAGGRDNGAPGERSYHPGYYAAFALDPDGNNVEAVYHGPHHRSAASVEISV
ncbi:VOC family protein [Phenylobacterium sp. VNQ135]|uniref:VOC family protein n=1 Tax=Phenylobacterium sp. VNQ135 TaxID=3400922 RepID=UPI003C0DC32A